MPLYEYFCEQCSKQYDVYKSIKEYDKKDKCPLCKGQGYRILSCNIQFLNEKVESAEYSPALGMIVKNKKHREEICKAKGLIEVGNENPDKIHDKLEKERAEKREKAYEDIW